MMDDDLWAQASADHETEARIYAQASASAELDDRVLPFLLSARTVPEFEHRAALAWEPIVTIAMDHGLEPGDLMATVRRRYDLCRTALMEGEDPLDEVVRASQGSGYGSGPEKPDEHSEGPDFAGDYAEIPQGAPRGPAPQVTSPRPPRTGPVSEPTAGRVTADTGKCSYPHCGKNATTKVDERGYCPVHAAEVRRNEYTQRQGSLRSHAQAPGEPAGQMMTQPYMPMPVDTGTGGAAVDMSTSPESDGMLPALPAGLSPGSNAPVPPSGQVTSSRDPVRRRVMAVTAAISAVNPQLPQPECERVARLVVGRYLIQADLAGSVTSDEPVSSGESGSGGSSGGGEGTGLAGHLLEGQGLRSMWQGMSGGGSEAAGSLIGDAAELAAI